MNFRANEIGLGKTTKHAFSKYVNISVYYSFALVGVINTSTCIHFVAICYITYIYKGIVLQYITLLNNKFNPAHKKLLLYSSMQLICKAKLTTQLCAWMAWNFSLPSFKRKCLEHRNILHAPLFIDDAVDGCWQKRTGFVCKSFSE